MIDSAEVRRREPEVHWADRAIRGQTFAIIGGNYCGRCLHVCPAPVGRATAGWRPCRPEEADAAGRARFADLILTQEIRGYAIDQGMDLVGVASIDRLADLSAGFAPTEYMPEATCVVSFVCALADGICDVWGTFEDDGKTVLPLGYYGVGNANWELARVANGMAAARVRGLPQPGLPAALVGLALPIADDGADGLDAAAGERADAPGLPAHRRRR